MSETTNMPPEGAVPVTAADVVSVPTPERYEDVVLWAIESAAGKVTTVIVRPDIGDKGGLHTSPLDGSILGIKFEFHSGDGKNEKTGEQYFPAGPGLFNFALTNYKMPHYKNGAGPADIELKRRAKEKEDRIEARARLLAQTFDDEDEA